MKKLIALLLISFFTISIYAEDKLHVFIDVNKIDMKNYVWDSKVETTYNGKEGTGIHNISQFVVNSKIEVGDKIFSLETLLINEKDKADYVILTGEDRTEKPIKLLTQDDYKSILEKITKDKDKQYIESLYESYKNYYLLKFPVGKSKKSTEKKVRSIFSKAGFEYNKIIAWKISFNKKNVTGQITDIETILDLMINGKKLTGDYEVMGYEYDFDGQKLIGDVSLGEISYTFGNKKFICETSIDFVDGLKGDKFNLTYDYLLPSISDEELLVLLLDTFYFNLISRY